ncbi:hypothetical protein ACQP2Y_21950 [Actinoplanes sp. CA-051413]|uniref:hypothetical protein n=1 Tax=Actinoplanes sp. CA-051413 TaxID=3239899 RepID=UPI003D962E9F
MHTDTRIERPTDDVLARLEKNRNDASTSYRARHAHKPGPAAESAAKARVSDYLPAHEKTELIPAVMLQAVVPLPQRPAIPPAGVPAAAVSVPAIEPPAAVTVGMLERVLRGLRSLRGKP